MKPEASRPPHLHRATVPPQDVQDVVRFLNAEAQALASLQPPLPKAALRGHMRDRLGEAYAFPLALRLRALVAGERHVGAVDIDAGGQGLQLAEGTRCLEVVPEGLTREAAALIGPILLPTDRPLQSGSVVTIDVVLEDPRRQALAQPGLLAKVTRLDARVAVEP